MTLAQIQAMYNVLSRNRREAVESGQWGSAQTYAHEMEHVKAQYRTQARKNKARRDRDDVMRSCGLERVRGALGGVYWE